MHKKYDIHPDDFVLINCFDAVLRIWLAETYGWRPLSDNERIAIVEFFKLRGSYMAGKGKHPETYEGMAAFVENWKKEQLRFEPQNKILADSLIEFILSDVPTIFRPIARAFFLSVGPDERLITNCHHRMPPVGVQKICRAAMKVYGRLDPLTDGLMPQTRNSSTGSTRTVTTSTGSARICARHSRTRTPPSTRQALSEGVWPSTPVVLLHMPWSRGPFGV
ncbi:hypothetical protein SALBM311S_02291 [Streptomyces alboniger]